MARFFWITLITIISGLIMLLTYKSLEIVILLFSINFMVLGIELRKGNSKRSTLLLKLEGIERTLNDIASTLISPSLSKIDERRKEIIEWLNKF